MTLQDSSSQVSGQLDEVKLKQVLQKRLENIYPRQSQPCAEKLLQVIRKYTPFVLTTSRDFWDERDVILITYGNSLLGQDEKPLKTLQRFLEQYLCTVFNSVHVLPFFPYSSDDGFSVIDYRQVNPELGDWEDISHIAADFRLMVDLVINHVSRESLWFYDFIADIHPRRDFFIEIDPETDISMVTRPRNSPLASRVNTPRGVKHVWTTFSEDQVDLDFSNPDVLVEMVDIFLYYLANGASLVRLDAIAFLWKRIGTNCLHLPETHEVVKLLRDILDHVAPDCILLTETNVPHEENVSYFNQGDESHMVYQFALPPLVLHALNRGTANHLVEWASKLKPLPVKCTYFNFTASHDGIGLRALEGILGEHEVEGLIECMHRFGGFVSMKANSNGKDTPYEINISLFDAMQGTRRGPDQYQVQRFICSQAIMLALQGIPGVYIHSMLATGNDLHGVELSGRTRSINRKRWEFDEITTLLDTPGNLHYEVFTEMKKLISIRRHQHAFHPESPQEIIPVSDAIFAVLRRERHSGKRLLALHNLSIAPQTVTITGRPELSDQASWFDLVTQSPVDCILPYVTMMPYQVMWLIEQD